MCGRFTLFEPDQVLAKEFGVSTLPAWSPRNNIAPSQSVATVRAASSGSGRKIALLRWGLIDHPGRKTRLYDPASDEYTTFSSYLSSFGRASTMSSSRPWNGSIDSTTGGCSNRLATSRRRYTRCSIGREIIGQIQPDSHKRVSTEPGTIHNAHLLRSC